MFENYKHNSEAGEKGRNSTTAFLLKNSRKENGEK